MGKNYNLVMAEKAREEAASILAHYFRFIAERSGIVIDHGNNLQREMEEVVTKITRGIHLDLEAKEAERAEAVAKALKEKP